MVFCYGIKLDQYYVLGKYFPLADLQFVTLANKNL